MVCFLKLKAGLTRQAGRHVDLGVEPLVGQQLGHAVQGFHGERVVGVGEEVDHGHRSLRQADLLGHEADAGAARLALLGDAPPAPHAVGQVHPASRVGRRGPLQDERGLLEGVHQVSRGGGRSCGGNTKKDLFLFFEKSHRNRSCHCIPRNTISVNHA